MLLDQPGLKGAGVGLVAHDKGARLVVRSELDPKARRSSTFKPFEPTLQPQAPEGVLGYLGVSGDLASALSRVLGRAARSTAGLGALLRGGRALAAACGRAAARSTCRRQAGTPTGRAGVTVLTRTARPEGAATLARLEGPIARLLGKNGPLRGR